MAHPECVSVVPRSRAVIFSITRSPTPLTDTPTLEVMHLDTLLDAPQITPVEPGTWHVAVAIPAQVLADGVQTFVIRDRETGAMLASFAIVTGQPLEDDLRAEISLLRAELDMLKGAFRRHCRNTGD